MSGPSTQPTPAVLAAPRGAEPPRRWLLVIVLGALTMLGPFTMDLYLPAFPAVQRELHTSQGAVQLTLTATAVGMGIGQLLVGPLSDAFGRRRPLLIATALHVVSSTAVAVAPTIAAVFAARLGQGLGAAAGAVVTIAIIRDLFGGYRLVRMLARLALIGGLAPIVAPVLGSQLLLVLSWRGVFAALALYGLTILVLCARMVPETLPGHAVHTGPTETALSRLSAVVHDRVYIGAAVAGSMVFASVITYLSTAPFVFQTSLGLNPQQFGLLFAVNAVGLLVANQVSARLMRVLEPAWILAGVLTLLLASGIALMVLGANHAGFIGTAIASFAFVSATGFANPCFGILTLKNHHGRAGTAAALSGFANSVVGGLISPLPGLLGGGTALTLGVVICTAMIIALASLWIILRPWRVAKLDRG